MCIWNALISKCQTMKPMYLNVYLSFQIRLTVKLGFSHPFSQSIHIYLYYSRTHIFERSNCTYRYIFCFVLRKKYLKRSKNQTKLNIAHNCSVVLAYIADPIQPPSKSNHKIKTYPCYCFLLFPQCYHLIETITTKLGDSTNGLWFKCFLRIKSKSWENGKGFNFFTQTHTHHRNLQLHLWKAMLVKNSSTSRCISVQLQTVV